MEIDQYCLHSVSVAGPKDAQCGAPDASVSDVLEAYLLAALTGMEFLCTCRERLIIRPRCAID